MVKKGRMSKIEEHYIKTNPSMSNEELAKELDRSVDSVSKVIRDTNESMTEELDTKAVDGTKVVKLKSKGYIAMTGAESTRADSIPQKFSSKRYKNEIRPARKQDD